MPAVAAAAEAGVGSVYRQFPSKQDLLAALVVERLEEVEGDALAALAGRKPPRAALVALLRAYAERQAGDDLLGEAMACVSAHPDVDAGAGATRRRRWKRLLTAAKAEGAARRRDDARPACSLRLHPRREGDGSRGPRAGARALVRRRLRAGGGRLSASEAAAHDHIEPYVWRIAGVVILGMIMSILDTTIVNVALDTLGRELHSPVSQIQWVVTGYLLSLAAVIPLTGWASRRFGAKRVYIVSLVLFTIGSALCGLASTTTSLVVFRVLQGAGGGMIMPVGQMIMAEVAGPKRMGRVMGITVMPAMLAPILGPVLGGLILQGLHWSWIFLVNVPIGVVAVILAARMLPHSDLGEAGRLDTVGLALLATSMPLAVYGLAEIGTTGSFTAPTVVWPILAGVVLAVAFVWHALRTERPLLDVRLYAGRVFGAASLTTFFLGAALFGAMILVPLYYQQVRGESVVVTGLLVGPQGLGMLLVGPLNGRLTERFGAGRVAVVGVSILCLSTIPFGFVGADTSILGISPSSPCAASASASPSCRR